MDPDDTPTWPLPLTFVEEVQQFLKGRQIAKPPAESVCPYRHVKGHPAFMKPEPGGTRRCERCGHTDSASDPSFVCSCRNCERKRKRSA